jgi:thymidine phosphorylase
MDTSKIGRASVETGAGRKTKADILDYGAGLIMKVRLGEYIKENGEIKREESYKRSGEGVKKLLEKYPSVKIAFA